MWFVKDESGATAIEYGLIAAGVSVAIISVVKGLGTNLKTTVWHRPNRTQITDFGFTGETRMRFLLLTCARRDEARKMPHSEVAACLACSPDPPGQLGGLFLLPARRIT